MMIESGPARRGHSRKGRLVGAAAAFALLVPGALLSGTTPASAADKPAVNPATRVAAATYPGVQLIEVDYTATLSVPQARVDDAALQALSATLARKIRTGAISSESELGTAWTQAVADDPLRYFKPAGGEVRTTKATLSGFGTGWVVTPDGYIVTAAHVIQPDAQVIHDQFAQTGLSEFAAADERLIGQIDGLTVTQRRLLTNAARAFDAHYLVVGDVAKKVTAQVGVAVAGFLKGQQGTPVDVISVGESYPGKDVAILKLDGNSHLPTLPVGNDADVTEGDTLYVAGYPAASTFFSGLSKDSQVQPTVTQGPLTAIKKNEGGTPILQTQAPASPGVSGGPVLDEAGNVIGILVASAVDSKGNSLEGQEFVIPVSVIREKLTQSNITPRTSDTTRLYGQALDAYFQHYYKRALPLFNQVKNLDPSHPWVSDFITKTQSAINAGKDETPQPVTFWLLIGAGALLVLLLGLAVVLVLVRRRRRPSPMPGSTAPGAGAPGPAGYYQQPPLQQPTMAPAGMQQPGLQQPGLQQPGIQQPGLQQPGYGPATGYPSQGSYPGQGYYQPGYPPAGLPVQPPVGPPSPGPAPAPAPGPATPQTSGYPQNVAGYPPPPYPPSPRPPADAAPPQPGPAQQTTPAQRTTPGQGTRSDDPPPPPPS